MGLEMRPERERVALQYADAITLSEREVDEDLFERVRSLFGEDAAIELTAVIAWENASSKFNGPCAYLRRASGNGRTGKRTRVNPEKEDHRANR